MVYNRNKRSVNHSRIERIITTCPEVPSKAVGAIGNKYLKNTINSHFKHDTRKQHRSLSRERRCKYLVANCEVGKSVILQQKLRKLTRKPLLVVLRLS